MGKSSYDVMTLINPYIVQACVWTADCEVGGCSNKCILNERLSETQSWHVLLGRSTSEDSFDACPLLARWVNRVIPSSGGTARRRLQADSVRPPALVCTIDA